MHAWGEMNFILVKALLGLFEDSVAVCEKSQF